MFPGGLQWHQGLDIAIRAFAKLRRRLPEAEFHIYGDGNMKPQLVALVQELELSNSVRFFSPLPIREIAAVMGRADLGVVPKRADSFGNEAYSTKIMEFMAVGVPVVVSSTKIDRYYFDESVVRFFESGNDEAMAEAMLQVLCNEELRCDMIRRAGKYVSQNSWERHKIRYLKLVDALVR
jgi:glycosyltransferase involved in cell wall biosynthesis